jgi:3-methylfumaryl-CoA hydratase
MFAGGRCEIIEPLRIGEPAERVSSLQKVTTKHGRTGELLFVTQRYELRQNGLLRTVEEQDIVYRSGHRSRQQAPAPDVSAVLRPDEPWHLSLRPDPTLLFRFSALTANTHRIHYDTPYVRDEEAYPGLLVHGPLLALLMLELVRRNAPSRRVKTVTHRLRSPVFAGEHLLACGTTVDGHADLHIATGRDARHATAEVSFA